MKKVLILIYLICFVSLASAADFTVSVSDTTGAKNSTVDVPIILEGVTDVGSMDMVLKYDPDVFLKGSSCRSW